MPTRVPSTSAVNHAPNRNGSELHADHVHSHDDKVAAQDVALRADIHEGLVDMLRESLSDRCREVRRYVYANFERIYIYIYIYIYM
jgi:hypothetical protein